MAVTKIWPIRKSISAPLDYVQNEEKTANPAVQTFTEGEQALEDVI